QISGRGREREEQQRDDDGDDLGQGARVRNPEGGPAAPGRAGAVRASAPFPGRYGQRSTGAASARRVAPEVALACVQPTHPAWNRVVDAAGVARGLELDPTVVREVRLDPRGRVLAADDVAVEGRLVRARTEATDEPGRDPQRPKHVPHRG